MKKNILNFLIVLLPFELTAQIYEGTPPVDSTTIAFAISDSTPNNIIPDTSAIPLWQIGNTTKSFFLSGSSSHHATMTDTVGSYPINSNNWFTLKLMTVPPNPIFSFWHRYQTSAGHDGGIVEFSFDTGLTWMNVIECPQILNENFYSHTDTLISGESAFSGVSAGEQYSRFQFLDCWIVGPMPTGCSFAYYFGPVFIRFRFKSDSIPDSLAGWMIDSIKIVNPGCIPGSVKNVVKTEHLNVYPNPSFDGLFVFPDLPNEKDYRIEVYNAIGKKVLENSYSHSADLATSPKGLYFYRVTSESQYYSGKLLLE